MIRLLRLILRVLAPLLFWIAQRAFKTRRFRNSPWVMSTYRLAADSGYRPALSVYGYLLHLHGDSPASRIQGGIYLQRAADKGDMKASFQMGRIFESGFKGHFRVDPDKALAYYRRAAEQGHVLAIGRLAEVYREGQMGQAADRAQADYWQGLLPG